MANTYLGVSTSSGETRTKWTTSFWLKRNSLSGDNMVFGSYLDGQNKDAIYFNGNKLQWFSFQANGFSNGGNLKTTRMFRDTNAWYHIVCRWDTANATADDRMKIWVNGVEETVFDERTNPTQNRESLINYQGYTTIGRMDTGYLDGCLSHLHFCDNQLYQASDFGETDSTTGEWKIKTSPSVSYGTTGYFVLKDGNSLTDQSSNSNNLTLQGGTLTKTEDCPSNVFATWNPLWSASNGNVGDVTFSNGNLTTVTSVSYRTTPTTLGMKSGKYYWEIKRNSTSSGDTHFGVMSENATPANTATWIGNAANGWVMASNGEAYTGGVSSGILSNGAVGNGAIFMGAYDGATGKLYFGVDGTWSGTANPSTGANAHFTLDTSLTYFPVVSTGDDVSANFGNGYFGTTAVASAGTNASGNGIFEFDLPTGYTALSTKGLNL